MAQTIFRFARVTTHGSKSGTPCRKIRRGRIIARDENTTCTLREINILREALNLEVFGEDDVALLPEGKDVSGANMAELDDQPLSQIVRQGDSFVCVPYDEANVPVKPKKAKPGVCIVADRWASNVKKASKTPVKGEKVESTPDPVTSYGKKGRDVLVRAINTFFGQQKRHGTNNRLVIDFTGAPGTTNDDIDHFRTFCEINEYDNVIVTGETAEPTGDDGTF